MMRSLTSVADAIEWLVDAVFSPREGKESPPPVVPIRKPSPTTRVYTVHYAPRRSTTFFAVEYEIVDWKTEIVDHVDGSVEYIATPEYAECAARPPVETLFPASVETIETSEELDVAALLAQEDVISVTWEDITPAASLTNDIEDTAREYGDEPGADGEGGLGCGVPEVAQFDFCHSPFGVQLAVHCWLLQLAHV
jgi:hypothetical protein